MSGFSTDYFYVFFALGRDVSLFFDMPMRNWHLNSGLKLLLKIPPIPVFDHSLLSHACAC